MPARVVTFDVFDTLLTRRVGEPEAVGLLLGRRLRAQNTITCDPEVFARQRRLADERASHQAGGDPPLALVHAELARGLGLDPALAEEMRRAELELERELLFPVPGAAERVAAARARGERVAFVSDTNFTSAELRGLLEANGLARPADDVFASCELGAAKHRGTLYPVVAARLGQAAVIRHHGDDPRSDVRHARGSGWQAVHLPQARLNRYERILERHRFATGGLGSVLAGASRAARLEQDPGDAAERALVEVAAGVMAPMLAAWMTSVLRRAAAEGIGCLYFLSRDGEVMLDVARRLEGRLQTGVQLRYLRGSRTTWLPAAASEDSSLESFNLDRDFRSVRTVLASVGLSPEAAAALLPAELSEPATWDRPLDEAGRAALDGAVASPELRALALARGRELRSGLADYLRQEGWEDGPPVALVDVGWRGRMVRALSDVCDVEGLRRPARVFFFGVRHDAHEIVGEDLAGLLEGWFYDHARNTGHVRHMVDLEACVEMFCAAAEGSVLDYAREDGGVRPVLGPARADLDDWGLPLVRRTVCAFADALVLDPGLVDVGADARAAVRDVLEAFWTRPAPAEVGAWSRFPLTIDMFHSQAVGMAEPITLRRVVEGARRGRFRLRPDMSWPEGTTRVSAVPWRAALGGRRLARRELPRVRRRFRMTAVAGATAARRAAGRLGGGR